MRSLLPVLAGVAVGAAGREAVGPAAAGDPPRQFGPEWVRVGDELQKAVMVKVTHAPLGNVSGYELKMEHNSVWATEIDGGLAFHLVSPRYGELSVYRDARGKALDLSARLGDNHYVDIDGDGMIDGLCDKRGGGDVTMVVVGDRLARVVSHTGNFRYPPNRKRFEWGFNRDVWYLFEKGTWKAMDPRVERPE